MHSLQIQHSDNKCECINNYTKWAFLINYDDFLQTSQECDKSIFIINVCKIIILISLTPHDNHFLAFNQANSMKSHISALWTIL